MNKGLYVDRLKRRIKVLFCGAVFLAAGSQVYAKPVEKTVMEQNDFLTVYGDAQTETEGYFVTEKGETSYVYTDGSKANNQFLTIEGKTYYFNKKGIVEKGWMKLSGEYYYLDRTSGVLKKNGKVDGIKLAADGKAKENNLSKKKMDTMIKAKNVVNKNTKATDSKEAKLKIMFNWVVQGKYQRFRRLPEARKKKGWEITYANDMFKNSKRPGCCVSNACTFAYFARECGYSKVYVCDDTDHAWTEINGKVYDTLFAEMKTHGGSEKKPNYKDYFKSTYKKTKLVRVNKLKI